MNIGIFLQIDNAKILPVGLELIGKTLAMMGDIPHKIHGIVAMNNEDKGLLSDPEFKHVMSYLDETFVYEYQAKYLTTEHCQDAVCDYVRSQEPEILLVGATPLGRSFAPRVAAHCKTGITADCTEIGYDQTVGLEQIRPAYGEEILAEIATPKTFPQMATVRPGVMDPPTEKGEKNPKLTINEGNLSQKNLTIIARQVKRQPGKLDQAKLVVVAGNAIKEGEDLALVKQLAHVLGGEWGVTRPLVAGGLAPYSRQVGVSGTILSASVVLLLGVSGSNQTLTGIRKAKKIIAINDDPDATLFNKVDIGIVDDWKNIVTNILEKREGKLNG